MSWAVRIRRGEGPIWGRLKKVAKAILDISLACEPVNSTGVSTTLPASPDGS